MGLFSDIRDAVSNPSSIFTSSNAPANFVPDRLLGGDAARELSESRLQAARDAGNLQAEFSDVLREDAAPLRELRNNRLLDLQNLFSGEGDFQNSSDFRVVRDAALSAIDPSQPGVNALTERANQIGFGQFIPFRNRVATEAGVSSRGLNTTNRLLQNNTDNRVALLNRSGVLAGNDLINASNARRQTVSGLAGLAGGFA